MEASAYVMIWVGLMVLTAVTVTVTALQLGQLAVLAAIGIALIKSSLVVFYFMNLRREPRVFKIMLSVALLTLAVIMLLTFLDVSFRQEVGT